MKPTELRIGNQVSTPNPNMNPFKIEYIESAGTGKVGGVNSLGSFVYWDCSGIKPILLTEDRLKEFGFELKENTIWNDLSITPIIFSFNGYFIEFINSDDIIVFAKMDRNGGHHIRNIKYVHQLQNIYFELTGEELTIDQSVQRDGHI